MNDLGDEIRRRVERAREAHQQEQEQRQCQKEQEAEKDKQRKARVRELADEVERPMREAAKSSDGAITFQGPIVAGTGATAYDLYWETPPPRRGFRVTIDYLSGLVQCNWVSPDEGGAEVIDALNFDMNILYRWILGLAEQEFWASGRPPRI